MGIRFQSEAVLRVIAALALALVVLAGSLGRAAAQEPVADPWRVLGLASGGLPLRVTRRADLGQETFAPAFIDTQVGLFLPGRGAFRHGPLLGLSTNLTIDGGFYAPVNPLSQWVALVGYMARYALSDDVFALAHLAVPFELGETGSVGVELSGGLAYRVLAGFGGFAALSGDAFGAEGGASVITSFELGLFIDYEVLP